MHFISTKGKHHCIQIAFPTSPPKHLYSPLLERLLRERSSTCLLLLLHIPTLTNGNCEVDSFQITKLIKKYVSFSFSFVSWFPNFFLPLPVCPRMITSRIDHRRKKKSGKKKKISSNAGTRVRCVPYKVLRQPAPFCLSVSPSFLWLQAAWSSGPLYRSI